MVDVAVLVLNVLQPSRDYLPLNPSVDNTSSTTKQPVGRSECAKYRRNRQLLGATPPLQNVVHRIVITTYSGKSVINRASSVQELIIYDNL